MRPSHSIPLLCYWWSFLKPHWEEIQSGKPISNFSDEARLKVKQWWERELGMDEFHPALENPLTLKEFPEECVGVVELAKVMEVQKMVSWFRELAHECDFYL